MAGVASFYSCLKYLLTVYQLLLVVTGIFFDFFILLYTYSCKGKKSLQLFKMQVSCGLSYLNFSGLASFESVHFPSAIFRLHFQQLFSDSCWILDLFLPVQENFLGSLWHCYKVFHIIANLLYFVNGLNPSRTKFYDFLMFS